jgi:hypothetical protein
MKNFEMSPLEVVQDGITFTYDGRFLQHLGHHYDSNIESFIPALDPVVSKKGASKKKPTRKPPTKSAAWWKAQCALRGIDPAGTIPQLQQRLRADTNAPMLPELKEKEAKLKDKQKAKEREGKPWDVTGSYDIKCPVIQDEYDDTGEHTLDIMSEDTAKGRQLFASFNFGIITGFFRFESQEAEREASKEIASTSAKVGDKRKREERDDGDEDDYEEGEEYHSDEYEGRRSPTPEKFYLGSEEGPSAQNPTWNYRWRGEETGEGEIQLFSDENVYKITFLEPNGTKLKGTFGCEYVTDCEFTGRKISMEPGDLDIDISDAWAERNEISHEKARVGRWH